MSLGAKSLVISLNLEVLERIRKENEQNTVWGDSFTDEIASKGGWMKLDILGTGIVNE